MDAYKELAASYDRLTNDVDYAAVVDFYQQILEREGLRPRTCVDLACGTGSVSVLLAERGMDVIGVDMSEDMLRRSRILVVCGAAVNETVLTDIAIANRFHVASSTMRGVLGVDKSRKEE